MNLLNSAVVSREQETERTSEKMTECLDDILELRDDDSDTLETLEPSDDDLDQMEDLQLDVDSRKEPQYPRARLTRTEVEVEAIRVRLARSLQTAELEETARQAEQAQCLLQANLPASLDFLKHLLIEEFETVCQNEKALVFLLCGQTKIYIKNL